MLQPLIDLSDPIGTLKINHWSLDVIFGEDQSRKRIRNAAQNFSTIRKMALNLLKAQGEKISVNRKRNKCALSDQYREACTHGGEALAGLRVARERGWVQPDDIAVLDSTAHALKFSGFQDLYFANRFPAEFEIRPNPALINHPVHIRPKDLEQVLAPGRPISGEEFELFVRRTAEEIAARLAIAKKSKN